VTTLVVGIGQRDRGDDVAGLLVADLLRDTTGVVARGLEVDATAILSDPAWDASDRVVLVDAVRTGAPPGTVHRWDGEAVGRLEPRPEVSSHGLGLDTTVRLATALGRCPRRLQLLGIEGSSFVTGTPPSPAVTAAAHRLAGELADAGAGGELASEG
jgi:hydrogenase maturation protease